MFEKFKKGFTLIELLVVIAIIGILSGIIIVTMSNTTSSATVAKGQVFSNSLRNALGVYIVAEYKLDGNANDTWGSHTAGTISGATSQSSCPQGSCYSFASGNYIELADSSDLRLATGGTISAWIYPKSVGFSGLSGRIIHKGTDVNATSGYQILLDDICRLAFNANGVNYTYSSNNSLVYNQWNLVTVTFDSTSGGRKIYVNGVDKTVLPNTYTDLPPNVAGVVRIGNVASATNRTFDGYIDDVQIYNQVVPASRVREMYVAGLKNLLAKGEINQPEYEQRLTELEKQYAEK